MHANIAGGVNAGGQRGFLFCLKPELGHRLGITPELDPRGGECRSIFLPQDECLAKLGLEGLQA